MSLADYYKPQDPRIMVRLSHEEREAVLRAAVDNKVTISEFVRMALREVGLDVHATSTKQYNQARFFEKVAYSRKHNEGANESTANDNSAD